MILHICTIVSYLMGLMTKKGKALKCALLITLCALTGVLLSTLPHILAFLRTGQPIWFADHDDLLYGTFGSYAYSHATWSVQDPVTRDGGATIYPWLQFMPGILIARFLHLGGLEVNLVWRVLAGASIALAWFVFFAHYFGKPLLATSLALFMLADIGLLSGKPLLRQIYLYTLVATGHPGRWFDLSPLITVQWRLITPALSLPYMLIYWWLLARARERATWLTLLSAGTSFGLLFYVYTYYWTAAALGLAIAFVLDSSSRRVYFHVGWVGLLVGAPALLLQELTMKNSLPDWLHRTDLLSPINRLSELNIPVATVVMLGATGVWVLSRRRDLIYLWAIGVAALLLQNHQLITGLQVQNFHWAYVWGPALSSLSVLIIADAVSGFAATRKEVGSAVAWIGTLGLILHVSAGFWLRGVEATRTRESVANEEAYSKFRAQRLSRDAVSFSQGLAVAGDQRFVNIAAVAESVRTLDHYAVLFSPGISDAEWDRRIALNALLSGTSRDAFVAQQSNALQWSVWGPWLRSRGLLAKRVSQRIAAYDSIATRVYQFAVQFGVGYVALPIGGETPSNLRADWDLVEDGPHWRIWRRRGS
jgi:hypothetical protein